MSIRNIIATIITLVCLAAPGFSEVTNSAVNNVRKVIFASDSEMSQRSWSEAKIPRMGTFECAWLYSLHRDRGYWLCVPKSAVGQYIEISRQLGSSACFAFRREEDRVFELSFRDRTDGAVRTGFLFLFTGWKDGGCSGVNHFTS